MEPLRLASLWSRALAGAKAIPVAVEVHLGNGLPQFQIVGLPDAEVRESRDRVRVALQASGFEYPMRRITVNLAPADLPKESGRFDLPLALGILMASGQLPPPAHWPEGAAEVVGELGLDGSLKPVRGALAMAWEAHASGRALVLPAASAAEVALFPQLRVMVAESLAEVCRYLQGGPTLASASAWIQSKHGRALPDNGECADDIPVQELKEVQGQAAGRLALEVAAAGGHSLLFHGPPGCGKTLLANCLQGLLPPLNAREAAAHAINCSLAGKPVDAAHLFRRPFRRPHHTSSAISLTGGGYPLRPGEMSLAHRGVLFLDELPEFSRACIEALREPLESGIINVARVTGVAAFPAEFQLLCTMNPCPCGQPRTGTPGCHCTPLRILQYRARLSMPVLDRIDLWVPLLPEAVTTVPEESNAGEVNAPAGQDTPSREPGPANPQAAADARETREAVRGTQAKQETGESTAVVRERVDLAWRRQVERQGCANARLGIAETLVQARLGRSEHRLWHRIAAHHRLSARGAHRLLRVARTLADLAKEDAVSGDHLAQAAAWRTAF